MLCQALCQKPNVFISFHPHESFEPSSRMHKEQARKILRDEATCSRSAAEKTQHHCTHGRHFLPAAILIYCASPLPHTYELKNTRFVQGKHTHSTLLETKLKAMTQLSIPHHPPGFVFSYIKEICSGSSIQTKKEGIYKIRVNLFRLKRDRK